MHIGVGESYPSAEMQLVSSTTPAIYIYIYIYIQTYITIYIDLSENRAETEPAVLGDCHFLTCAIIIYLYTYTTPTHKYLFPVLLLFYV